MIETVRFEVNGEAVVGDLHLPTGKGPFPGVIVGGPMTSVKEQVTGTYAAAMAARGFAALSLDHRHYGQSAGEPRHYEYYPHKIEDLRAGLDQLGKHAAVDPGRVFAPGVCLGAGYTAHAIAGRDDVRGFAAVAGDYRDVPAMRAADPEGFDAKVAQGRAAREHYERTGELLTVPAVALDRDAAMTLQSTFDYYAVRAVHPNYCNAFAVMSREHFLSFDVQPAAANLETPFLMLHGEKALNPAWADRFFDAVPGLKERAILVSKGQTDIYDDPGIVAFAGDRIRDFFNAVA